MEKALYPLRTMRITQGYNTTPTHVGTYALDDGSSSSSTQDYAYAPFSGTVMRIYSYANVVWFQSDAEVMCADGIARQLIMSLFHINDSDLADLGLVVGKHFNQGERFYREGTKGYVTGSHIHIEIGLAPFTGTGWYKSTNIDSNGNNVWIINNQLVPHNILFLTQDTTVLNNNGYSFKVVSSDPQWMELNNNSTVEIIKNNCEYFNTLDINDTVGKLTVGEKYVVTAISNVEIQNFTWLKINVSGTQYYSVYLKDRIKLHTNAIVKYKSEGIDVSKYQGVVDWAQVKDAGYEFAIIRVSSSDNNGKYIDPYFESNMKNARAAGLKLGAYIYTYASSNSDIDSEITFAESVLDKYYFEYPIFIDFEDNLIQSNGKDLNTSICAHGFETLLSHGYYPGLYCGKNWSTTYIDAASLSAFPFWLAHYTTSTDSTLNYGIWQYGGAAVSGVSGNCDVNHGYIDWEAYIEWNNYNNMSLTPIPPIPDPPSEGEINVRICPRHDTEDGWKKADPILLNGEMAVATNVGIKFGNGTDKWSTLEYYGMKSSVEYCQYVNNAITAPFTATIDIPLAENYKVGTVVVLCARSKGYYNAIYGIDFVYYFPSEKQLCVEFLKSGNYIVNYFV